MYLVNFGQLIRHNFKTAAFHNTLEIPFTPMPGMYFSDGEWGCLAHEVTWDIEQKEFRIYAETIQAASDHDNADLIAYYENPDHGWTRTR